MRFWPGRDPIGKRLSFDSVDGRPIRRQVVGIVKNTRDLALDRQAEPAVYVPMEQGFDVPQFLGVRTRVSAAGFAPALRAAVAAVDKDQPVFVVTSMRDLLDDSIAQRRFSMRMLAGFGALALILAALGIYGVVSYSTSRRAQEIGLRVALGARPRDVLRLVSVTEWR
jgi:putative ABC transport system permease protein